VIVGRAPELEVIDRLLAGGDRGGVLLIEGEAGIGKSTLIDEACRRADDSGLTVWAAGGEETASAGTLALLARAMGSDPGPAGRAVIERAGQLRQVEHTAVARLLGAEPPVPAALLDEVLDAIEQAGKGRALLLALDDVQWADPSTLHALSKLARRAVPLGLILVLGFRPVPRPAGLDALLDAVAPTSPVHLRLRPLDAQSVEALLDLELRGAGADAIDAARAHAAGAAGSPFFLVELVRALRQPGALDDVLQGGSVLPFSLRDTLLRRVRLAGEPASEVLRTAAIFGRQVSVDEVAALTGRRVVDVASAVTDATAAGILAEDGDGRLAFRHDLVREAILEELPGAVRSALHREAARVLEERGAAVERIVRHLVLGAEVGDTASIGRLRQVARDAIASDAVDLLGTALDACNESDPQRSDLEAELAEALVWAGRVVEGESRARLALLTARDPAVMTALRATRCHALFMMGRAQDALTLWAQDRRESGTWSAEELAETSAARLFAGDVDGARSLAAEATARYEAGTDHDRAAASIAYCVQCWTAGMSGDFASALDHSKRGVAAAFDDGSPRAVRHGPELFRAIVLDSVEDPDTDAAFVHAQRTAAEHSGPFVLPLSHAALAIRRYRTGQWDEALAECEAGRAVGAESGTAVAENWLAAVTSLILVDRGDVEGARAVLERTGAADPRPGLEWYVLAQARVLEASGDIAAAQVLVAGAGDIFAAMGLRSAVLNMGVDLVRLSIAVGDDDASARFADVLATFLDDAPPVIAASAAFAVALARGDGPGLVAAADRLAECGRPYEAAHARHRAALVIAADDPDQARDVARVALRGYDELGAVRADAMLRAELRAAGLRVRLPHASVGAPTIGWPALTPTERRVVDLVAKGMTNAAIAERLVVSRRTVESHLVRVYDKVGTRSRLDLAQQAAARAG
jgi:DNA-binding CsgD family transcriptional regulator